MRGLARLVRVAAAALAVALVAGCGSSLQQGGQGAADGPVKVGLLIPSPGSTRDWAGTWRTASGCAWTPRADGRPGHGHAAPGRTAGGGPGGGHGQAGAGRAGRPGRRPGGGAVADEIAVLGKGEIVHRSPTPEFRRNATLASRLLGV